MNWPTVSFLFEPRDLWIGAFIDRAKRRLYILPLPTLGIVLSWPKPIPEVAPIAAKQELPVIIVAYSFEEARRYAHSHGLNGCWDYAGNPHNLYGRGRGNCRFIKLKGWAEQKSAEFVQAVERLEAEL